METAAKKLEVRNSNKAIQGFSKAWLPEDVGDGLLGSRRRRPGSNRHNRHNERRVVTEMGVVKSTGIAMNRRSDMKL